ncbi:Luciferase-like monooxygenase [Catenulispora acidiphila DSM 44928]|uniref:Luciferase-like monooxygenase n=1 Tax=Catenulispora acidiphila (strain DSM 44928 / JCM 14897 / NBRC 102108 / NRRL B-24433 / ID139908) TaxID=479433 RepID=C7Q9N3_CATAD|nr:LLM class flavin-dependent oxidoreductase [Catenulispora acidiphila]ACU76202.1 Luciferase-like monooxygenase [Catenulispora acidiphila DSM 44928]
MEVGIGLPISAPELLLDWARAADTGPFTTLGLLDRLVYDNPEPLIALSVLAGATRRIRLQTEVLLAPLRDPVLLAKQAATLDRISEGRFVLGLGVGGREDDHEAAGTDLRTRGRLLDRQMAVMQKIWSGAPYSDTVGPIGPLPYRAGGPQVLFGGFQPAALKRVARFGDGFLAAAPPSWIGSLIDTVHRSWAEAGRSGVPRIVAQANAALGPQIVVDDARTAMAAYYRFAGDRADQMVAGMLTTEAAIRQTIAQYADLGVDEVMLYCYGADPGQVDRLAEAL